MSFEPVDFYVTDQTSQKNPLAGVIVRIFSVDRKTVFGEQVTDAGGHAAFLLETNAYEARFYKFQVNFRPTLFSVLAAPALNAFDVQGQAFQPPVASDSRFCMVSGFFRDFTGAPAKFATIELSSEFDPVWLEGAAVMTQRQTFRTNENGYIEFQLIRNGKYIVSIGGIEDMTRHIDVPDAPSVDIADLLFSVVQSITFDPVGPYTLVVGADLALDMTVMSSDGNVVPPDKQVGQISWTSSDPNVLAVLLMDAGKLHVRGIGAGTATVTAARMDQSIIRIPDPGIQGLPITFTVTP